MKNLKVNSKFKKIIKGGATFALVTSLTFAPAITIDAADNQQVVSSQANVLSSVELEVSKGVNIYYNDKAFLALDANGNETYPFIYNGTTYLPVRAISQLLGFEVKWDSTTNSIYIKTGDKVEDIQGSNKENTKLYNEKVNGVKGVKIYIDNQLLTPKDANGKDVDIYIINGTTYLPVRAISESLGVKVAWDDADNSVYLGKHKLYPNVSDEINDNLMLMKEYAKELEPLMPTLIKYTTDGYVLLEAIYNEYKEVMRISEETQSDEILKYWLEYKELYDRVDFLQGPSYGSGDYIYIFVCYPEDCRLYYYDRNISDEDFYAQYYYSYYFHIHAVTERYNHYPKVLAGLNEEKIKEYTEKFDELYNKITSLYKEQSKQKTMQIN